MAETKEKAAPALKFITVDPANTVAETAWFLSLHSQVGAWKLLNSYLQQALPASCYEKSGPNGCAVHHHVIDRSIHMFFRNGKAPYIIEEKDADQDAMPVPRTANFDDCRALFVAIAADFTPTDIEEDAPAADDPDDSDE